MATQLTPLGRVIVGTIKWVVIPVIVGLIGLNFVGPYIGGGSSSLPAKQDRKGLSQSPQSDHEREFMKVREGER